MMKKIILLLAMITVTSCAKDEEAQTPDSINQRLAVELTRLGFEGGIMPPLPPVFGPYEATVVVDKEVYITASAPFTPEGTWMKGLVTNDSELADIVYAAELSAIQAINRITLAADGDLNNVAKLRHVNVMTTAPADYPHTDVLANVTSDLLIRVFGEEVGSHTRSIIRSTSLPINMTHETEIRAVLK